MEKIIILDFGSQVTQVIGRRVRELNVYCEIYPFNKIPEITPEIKGVILSGSPYSVRDKNAPQIDLKKLVGNIPVLAICYGAQYIAHTFGGSVESSQTREYGRAELTIIENNERIFEGIPKTSEVWMSHGDSITQLPTNAKLIASTPNVINAAYKIEEDNIYALQFHPEVFHSAYGGEMIKNFVHLICNCSADWTTESFIESTVKSIKNELKDDKVILGLSGGVDSTVAAVLINKAIGNNLHCIFVDNGLLRKDEFTSVIEQYKNMGLNVIGVDASKKFLTALKGVTDPEEKRKAIGKTFIEVFEEQAKKITNAKWLAQGTIYPDVIESNSVKGPSATIKSHHNVGGLPEKMNLKIIEPLRSLFKDEVRKTGIALGIRKELIARHPFPGPGLGIRVLGEVTEEKLNILKEADAIYINLMKGWETTLPAASNGFSDKTQKGDKISLYDAIWQAGAIILPVKSVGVMGDERTYEYTIALRAVTSNDGMTADWVQLPYDFLAKVSNEIINKVKGVNRVCYDISSKPPATIEWE